MAQIILAGDGLTIEIADEIAKSDEMLKKALAPHYPDLANAQITREEKDGVLNVTVSKRAGPKGSDPGFEETGHLPNRVIAELDRAAQYLNPALALAWHLFGLDAFNEDGEPGLTLENQLALQGRISEAILEGEAQALQVQKAVEALKTAPATPASRVVKGF